MGNESRTLNETGTYSAYFNSDNIDVIEKLGIEGLGPATVVDKLCEKAEQYYENQKKREEEIRDLKEEIEELREMNDA